MKLRKIFYRIITLSVFVLASCNNLMEEDSTSLNNISTEATLSIDLQGTGRTILPNAALLSELENFQLIGILGEEDYYKYQKKYGYYYNRQRNFGPYHSITDLQNEKIKLDPGEWTFTLTAKKENTTYKAEKTQSIVQGENTISFNLVLEDSAMISGTGNFSLTLDFAEAENSEKVTTATARIQKINGDGVNGFSERVLNINNGNVVYSETGLSAGSYRALITLYSGTFELLTWREIVVIAKEHTSSAIRLIKSFDEIYKINYVLNDDEERKAYFRTSVQENYSLKTLPFNITEPVRPSYKFLGWYDNSNLYGEPISVLDSSKLKDVCLYAKWQSLFSDSSLKSLSFNGTNVTIYDNENQRNEVEADVNTYEYYIEYKTLSVRPVLSNSNASVTLSNNDSEMKIDAYDSSLQDITLTVTSEDNTTSKSYLIHTVKLFSYTEACNVISNRNQAVKIKIIGDNIKIKGTTTAEAGEKPSYIGAATKGRYDVSIDLSLTSITEIGDTAFVSCRCLKEIIFPNTLSSIGVSAFKDCQNLVEIDFPDSLETIGRGAFSYCSRLKEISIPNIEHITSNMFQDCRSLKIARIPSSVKYIDGNVFKSCTYLKEIIFEDTTSMWYGSEFEDFRIKYTVGSMNSPEDNISKLSRYQYYKIF